MPETTAPPIETPPDPRSRPVSRPRPRVPACRSRPRRPPATAPAGLTDRFRVPGFPGEVATLPFDDVLEERALTVTGGPDPVRRVRAAGVALGADQRWAWTGVPARRGRRRRHVRRRAAADRPHARDGREHDPRDRRRDGEARDRLARSRSSPPRSSRSRPSRRASRTSTCEPRAINSIIESRPAARASTAASTSSCSTCSRGAASRRPATDGSDRLDPQGDHGDRGRRLRARHADPAPARTPRRSTCSRRPRTAGEAIYVFPPGQYAPRRLEPRAPRLQERRRARRLRLQSAVGRLYAQPGLARAVRGERRRDEHARRPAGAARAVQRRADRRRRPDRRELMPPASVPAAEPKPKPSGRRNAATSRRRSCRARWSSRVVRGRRR